MAVGCCLAADGFGPFHRQELVAPPLMWSEAASALYERAWRGELSADLARRALAALDACPVKPRAPRGLRAEAWRVADELGWAKTYDAEYVALARLLRCRLLTVDGRMRRGAARLGFVVGPDEL